MCDFCGHCLFVFVCLLVCDAFSLYVYGKTIIKILFLKKLSYMRLKNYYKGDGFNFSFSPKKDQFNINDHLLILLTTEYEEKT